eukprot:3921470-Prymnesium_polylepis.1
MPRRRGGSKGSSRRMSRLIPPIEEIVTDHQFGYYLDRHGGYPTLFRVQCITGIGGMYHWSASVACITGISGN